MIRMEFKRDTYRPRDLCPRSLRFRCIDRVARDRVEGVPEGRCMKRQTAVCETNTHTAEPSGADELLTVKERAQATLSIQDPRGSSCDGSSANVKALDLIKSYQAVLTALPPSLSNRFSIRPKLAHGFPQLVIVPTPRSTPVPRQPDAHAVSSILRSLFSTTSTLLNFDTHVAQKRTRHLRSTRLCRQPDGQERRGGQFGCSRRA